MLILGPKSLLIGAMIYVVHLGCDVLSICVIISY